jgi:hypothetical protein
MGTEYLPAFQGASLEDSYFLGLLVEGRDLRLKVRLHSPSIILPMRRRTRVKSTAIAKAASS